MSGSSSKPIEITVLRVDEEPVIEIPGVTLNLHESKPQGPKRKGEATNIPRASAIPEADKMMRIWLVYLGSTSNIINQKCTESSGKSEPVNLAPRKDKTVLPHSHNVTPANLKTSVERLLKKPVKKLKLDTPAKEDATVGAVLKGILDELNNKLHSKEANTKLNHPPKKGKK